MKAKKKRVGSFLCFGAPPVTDENYEETKERGKKSNRRMISKIAKSMSFNPNSSSRRARLPKGPNRSLSREASESSSAQSAAESFGKHLDSAIFSSSLSTSSSSSPSSSCLSFDATTSAPEPKLPRKKAFLPPPAPPSNGYATELRLVLVSIFVMVICGRLCAILWTATWLFLVPRRRMVGRTPAFYDATAAQTRPSGDFSEEEKKRVVLEGFLQRNGNKGFDLRKNARKL